MKRIVALALFVVLLLSSVAFAEGKLTITEKSVIIKIGSDSGYFFAKVENTGDEAVIYDSGKLVIFSEDDDILETENYVSTYPGKLILQPGEYTYVQEFLWSSALKDATIGDVKFSVTTRDNWGTEAASVPCEATVDPLTSNSYDNYIYVTITNNTEETVYGYYVVVALHDQDGNLVFLERNNYDALGLHPGSTVTLKIYVSNDMIEYYEANGITVDSVDALVYQVAED